MTLRRAIGKVHLWLGLLSGLLVFFLGVTGCILAFEIEIRKITEPFRQIPPQQRAYLPPSQLKVIAEQHLRSRKAVVVEYPARDAAAMASYYDQDNYEIVFLDPYTGAYLQHKNMNRDFFRFMIAGHYNLWLPVRIGKPVVATGTLIFFVMLVSGIILWWPKNKAARKQRFSIKWSAKWRRKNYDLHNVLGFYAAWVAIFLAISGLVMGFEWAEKSLYWAASGKSMPAYQAPLSDTTHAGQMNRGDEIFFRQLSGMTAQESISMYFSNSKTDPVQLSVNHRPGTFYKMDNLYFDQYTGKPLPAQSPFQGKYVDTRTGDKLVRMNYDVHVGAIWGLPGKLLAFFASLIAGSLPVTGFMIWWGRRKASVSRRQSKK